ncbi:fucolectin-like isoform X2 [Saccostrea cucullata]|uniref:fucolectin-like isoform X2 n=1 Tax=Saccostrea cuccullata TaxID=36930 RepID=UPI002ED234DE
MLITHGKTYLQIAFLLFAVVCESAYKAPEFHGEFHLKFFGKLSDKYSQTIFSSEGKSQMGTLAKCSKFCVNDQRCIGIELCHIREDWFQCRVCCEWKKIGSNYYDDQPHCKYLEMEDKAEENVAASAVLSSIYDSRRKTAFAVDGVTECERFTCPHSLAEFSPWLRVDLTNKTSVSKVLVYNRRDCCGERFHDVSVNVNEPESVRNFSCGFFPGPAVNGDRILFLCENGAVGESVTIMMNYRNGKKSYLHVCEVEVFGKR